MTIPNLRWIVIGLIFLATVINYIDRQTMAVLKNAIAADVRLSNAEYATVQNTFLVFYGISQMVSGRIYDAIGTRLGFVFSIVVWSFAAIMHAFAGGAGAFKVWRAVLGFGEAGNWPGAIKAASEWFPARERALAVGIFNTGASIGGAVATPVIAGLGVAYGWRATFFVTGVLGFAWLAIWLLIYRAPQTHPWLGAAERAHIADGAARAGGAGVWRPGWSQLLRFRQTWAVLVARFLTDPIWWLYVFWLPAYFQEARGFSLQQVGAYAWFPFFAGGVGALSGGWLSGFLMGRGWTVDRARKTAMALGALLMPAGILAVHAESPFAALAFMGVVLFGFQVWINNVQTLPADFFPGSAVASVAGLGGSAAAAASILYNWNTGRVVDALGYAPVFTAAGVLGPLGLIAVLVLAGRIEPVNVSASAVMGAALAAPGGLDDEHDE